MNKITQFNSQNLKEFRIELTEAIKSLEKKYNVSTNVGSISYSPDNFNVKVSVALVNGGVVMTKEATDLERYRLSFNLDDKVKLNETFYDHDGKHLKVVGLKTRSPKFPVLCEDVNTGNRYKLTVNSVNHRISCKSINSF